MIQKILEIITRNSEAFSLIASFFAWVVGMFTNKGWEKIKKARRISALRLRKDRTCKIVMPTYNNIDLYPQSRSRTMFDVNSQGDVLASLNVVSFAGYVGLEFANEYYVLGEHPNEIVANNNIFCIGGIVANKQTRAHFSRFFPEFRIFNSNLKEDDEEGQKLFFYDKEKRGFRWGAGKEFTVSDGEHYAILVRLTKEDFGTDDAGTVYILYGNKMESTLVASKYLLCQINDLIKRTRRKKHFFIVMRIREVNGSSNIYFDDKYDLTDEMFPQDKENLVSRLRKLLGKDK